ncbi:MAG: heme ABC transporter ATP-binding protein [Candidatus Schmidhempelia sp.]|nr:heme ABC transporter ATP-binding protein [Candidatus Schmidhempelia sp.]
MLTAVDLCYQIGERQLIKQINLDIRQNEITAIIGPNGAGKSTLLRLLSGFLIPTQGQCLFLGQPLTDWNRQALSKKRTVMRQHCQINVPFTAQQVIAMGREPYGKQYFHQALESVIEQTHCQHLCYKDYRSLSGGEQQRVQLARVLAQLWQPHPSPRLLFLDEPTSALDLYHQQQMLRLLRELTCQQSLSVCCILHDLNLASLYADRILLIYDGQLSAHGSPQQVLTQINLTNWYQAELIVQSHPQHDLPQIFLIR